MNEQITIPTKAPKALLISMAIRYDHSFGFSMGISDQEIEEMRKTNPIMGGQYRTSSERESLLSKMSQLHEEVVGKGFYQYTAFHENYYNSLEKDLKANE